MHSADGWEAVLKPVVARYRGTAASIVFRGDAAFAQPNMYEFLEAEGIEYAIRLPANQILQTRIGHLLKRPVGRSPHHVQRLYQSFHYKAASWSHPRRVVAKVEWHIGELFPRVGFIVTNLRHASNQDRCKGRQPRPLRRVPDGGGRDSTAVVRGDHAENCRYGIASNGNGNMSAPATVCAGKTTGDLRPCDDATRGFAANRGDAGLTPRQTNGATWREP